MHLCFSVFQIRGHLNVLWTFTTRSSAEEWQNPEDTAVPETHQDIRYRTCSDVNVICVLFGNLAIEAVLWFRTLKIYNHSNHNVKCYLQTTQLLWATMIKWKHLSDNKLKIFIDARCNDLFLLCVLHMFTCFVLFFPLRDYEVKWVLPGKHRDHCIWW